MTTYNHIAELRAKAKRCLGCNIPMIGTSSTDRQKYCSPECRKADDKQKRTIKRMDRGVLNETVGQMLTLLNSVSVQIEDPKDDQFTADMAAAKFLDDFREWLLDYSANRSGAHLLITRGSAEVKFF